MVIDIFFFFMKGNTNILPMLFFVFSTHLLCSQVTYDMWDWMTHDRYLTHYMDSYYDVTVEESGIGHPLQSVKRSSVPNELMYVKFGNNSESIEIFNLIDGSDIYMSYEGLGGSDYRYYGFKNFKWTPRFVAHGETFYIDEAVDFSRQCYVTDCAPASMDIIGYPCRILYKSSFIGITDKDGVLSTQDVIELTTFWDTDGNITESGISSDGKRYVFEKYFYAKNYGLVLWEKWKESSADDGQMQLIESQVFDIEVPGNLNGFAPCWPTIPCDDDFLN